MGRWDKENHEGTRYGGFLVLRLTGRKRGGYRLYEVQCLRCLRVYVRHVHAAIWGTRNGSLKLERCVHCYRSETTVPLEHRKCKYCGVPTQRKPHCAARTCTACERRLLRNGPCAKCGFPVYRSKEHACR